jgi:hypothetical protein
VFVRYFTVLDVPADALRGGFADRPTDWLSTIALQSDKHRRELVSRVGVALSEHHSLSKVVRVSLGAPTRLGETTLLPMSWEATGPTGFFPVMDGDLEIAPLGERRTQLAMSARYRPPFGALGRVADRALLHRVAEATVKEFVDRVADVLIEVACSSNGSSGQERSGKRRHLDPHPRLTYDH